VLKSLKKFWIVFIRIWFCAWRYHDHDGWISGSFLQKNSRRTRGGGLRTWDKYRPFPEEINRRVTDAITTLYFAPTSEAQNHLLAEQLDRSRIFITGNTSLMPCWKRLVKIFRPNQTELRRALQRVGKNKIITPDSSPSRKFWGTVQVYLFVHSKPQHEIYNVSLDLSRSSESQIL